MEKYGLISAVESAAVCGATRHAGPSIVYAILSLDDAVAASRGGNRVLVGKHGGFAAGWVESG